MFILAACLLSGLTAYAFDLSTPQTIAVGAMIGLVGGFLQDELS